MNNDLKYLIALNHFPKFGPIRMQKIKKYFALFKDAFKADSSELTKAGIEENVTHEFIAARTSINPDEILEKVSKFISKIEKKETNRKITTYKLNGVFDDVNIRERAYE